MEATTIPQTHELQKDLEGKLQEYTQAIIHGAIDNAAAIRANLPFGFDIHWDKEVEHMTLFFQDVRIIAYREDMAFIEYAPACGLAMEDAITMQHTHAVREVFA